MQNATEEESHAGQPGHHQGAEVSQCTGVWAGQKPRDVCVYAGVCGP